MNQTKQELKEKKEWNKRAMRMEKLMDKQRNRWTINEINFAISWATIEVNEYKLFINSLKKLLKTK